MLLSETCGSSCVVATLYPTQLDPWTPTCLTRRTPNVPSTSIELWKKFVLKTAPTFTFASDYAEVHRVPIPCLFTTQVDPLVSMLTLACPTLSVLLNLNAIQHNTKLPVLENKSGRRRAFNFQMRIQVSGAVLQTQHYTNYISDLTDLTDTDSDSGDHAPTEATTSVSDPLIHPEAESSEAPTGLAENQSDLCDVIPVGATAESVDSDGLEWKANAPGLADAIAEELDKL